jgi:hypothetical protein
MIDENETIWASISATAYALMSYRMKYGKDIPKAYSFLKNINDMNSDQRLL